MMVTLLAYAYSLGVRSWRQIKRACQGDVALRLLAANQRPDHTSIGRVRSRHQAALKALHRVAAVCARAGMASVG